VVVRPAKHGELHGARMQCAISNGPVVGDYSSSSLWSTAKLTCAYDLGGSLSLGCSTLIVPNFAAEPLTIVETATSWNTTAKTEEWCSKHTIWRGPTVVQVSTDYPNCEQTVEESFDYDKFASFVASSPPGLCIKIDNESYHNPFKQGGVYSNNFFVPDMPHHDVKASGESRSLKCVSQRMLKCLQ
jgi:hypothetical protein